MHTIKPLLLTIIAACGVASGAAPPAERPDKKPPDVDVEDQHFCCTSLTANGFSGDGCVAISKENINTCDKVLYCAGTWKKEDGRVTCE